MKRMVAVIIVGLMVFEGISFVASDRTAVSPSAAEDRQVETSVSSDDTYGIQWEKSYGRNPMWSARYEGPQPVGDADNDWKNELLIGGRDPFLRVMKWDESKQTYYEQAKII
ncbi:MAG TPA: hypothetical protein ENL18_01900, partial [Thermoplasmatales archaeon]|nr:hypothetical protein [Thermoplasmatales archaeon]